MKVEAIKDGKGNVVITVVVLNTRDKFSKQ